MLSPEKIAEIAKYAGEAGNDSDLAALAGVSVAEVEEWRASLATPAAEVVEPEPEPEKPSAKQPRKAKAPAAVAAPTPAPAEAPAAVRVITPGATTVAWERRNRDGRIAPCNFTLTFGSILVGHDAAFAWKNHRAAVEPYSRR